MVPVEADGSVYFEMPAERFVFFQALDQDGLMVQSMRSGTSLQRASGRVQGCHESRYDSQPPPAGATPLALRRAPSALKPWYGPERDINYLSEVQPVFDAQLREVPRAGKEGERALNLCGDLGMVFYTSYEDRSEALAPALVSR
jgi:hypothetical protein